MAEEVCDRKEFTNLSKNYCVALATLDTATQNRTNSTCVTSPKVAKASKADILMVKMADGFAYKLC